jgi:sigma-B regulation protein RsbU (phosphoserine phosphatase)
MASVTEVEDGRGALERLTDAALAYMPLEELLGALLDRIKVAIEADTAAILVVDEDRRVLVARAARGIEEEVRQGVRIPIGRGFAGRVAAERRPVVIEDVEDADIFNPILRLKGIRSLLGVPLLVEGRVVGVLHVGTLVPRRFDGDDIRLLQMAADRAALAIELALRVEESAMTAALQRHLLPHRLPEVAGLRISAKYQPAVGARVGGDWYDVFRLPDQSVALVIGDTTGHGVGAAAVMAEVRIALRAYARLRISLNKMFSMLNELMMELESPPTTLSVIALDLDAAELTGTSAGHPPALLLRPDGSREFVFGASGPPLGRAISTGYETECLPFPRGSGLLLYTDGLIERRGESIDIGLNRLRSADLDRHPGLALADRLFAQLELDQPTEDDVAVLAVEARD